MQPQRGATYPPGTPSGDSTSCHSCACRQRKVAIDPAYAVEWAYIPHFYNSFYVYQYATCISAASYFAHAILTGGAKERDTYLTVLKAGGSAYPTEILQRAGLDMASPAPYRAVIATFKETLDQAEALIG